MDNWTRGRVSRMRTLARFPRVPTVPTLQGGVTLVSSGLVRSPYIAVYHSMRVTLDGPLGTARC